MILDGKATSLLLKEQLKEKVSLLSRAPRLAIFLVGNDPASQVYVRNKVLAARFVGIDVRLHELAAETTEKELLELVRREDDDEKTDALLVQLPLPDHINTDVVLDAISPEKDADGIGFVNQGLLYAGRPGIIPATPKGILTLLRHYLIPVEGKNALVIGHSRLVGKPMASLLLAQGATVTVAHDKTSDLKSLSRRADLIIVAAGVPRLVTADMVKKGVVLVDVGINRLEEHLVGDADFAQIAPLAAAITPVPGGVGPMTVVSLLENVLLCREETERKDRARALHGGNAS